MGTILLENIDMLATFDESRRRLHNAWILVRDNQIVSLGEGSSKPMEADQRINLTGHVVLPGLINTHHHHFQCLLRNVPTLQDSSLFRWLNGLFLIMSELRDEDQYSATMVNHKVLVSRGKLVGVDLPSLIDRHNELSNALVRRTERRYNLALSDLQWRRAYPYDPRADD